MNLIRLDHLVLTVADIAATCTFYQQVLGMNVVHTGDRVALHFAQNKINLHQLGHEFEPRAHRPAPGSADLCFTTTQPLEQWITHLAACGIAIIEGPVPRTGAHRPLRSIYFRDPDLNLIEVGNEEAT